ncbi:hypothetical protein M413DRAFT_441278 [Hebeloma cylindrosporum]|uniref:CCHC-type domain-containing protein n=1 Tax=Hebeloma cylindrosporum TaxID=76867 RepID=A0A0C3CQ46_HEBCY|nr:hypothetical protein M413DRAFT_441278 [Hebeloma cylindrosporum h7]
MPSADQIIDLTQTPDSDVESILAQKSSGQESRRSRRRKSRKSTGNSSPALINLPRRNSLESETPKWTTFEREDLLQEHSTNQCARQTNQETETATGSSQKDTFFIDLTPTAIPPTSQRTPPASNQPNDPKDELLIPSHVTVLGNTPTEIISDPLSDSGDVDFINYLDYGDTKHIHRYYDEPLDEAAILGRTVCKNCGVEGQHKTSACTVLICLTCGVRNEHLTRSCPIGKVCFTCGMKGHINANCPNRRSARALLSSQENDCDRCSTSRHKSNECPTMWGLYEYLSTEEQTTTINQRLSKKGMKLGEGGEGYVANDEWCYNCGHCGHLGDDCHDLIRALEEPSAFSLHNVSLGPFYNPEKEPRVISRAEFRDWEQVDEFSSWGRGAPDRVGRQGRMKSRAALERQSQTLEDDPDDWFGSATKRDASNRPSRDSRTMTFGRSVGAGRQYSQPQNGASPSLLARLGDNVEGSRSSRVERRHHRRPNGPRIDRDSRHRYEERPSKKPYSERHLSDQGPRYRGGYGRG